jgi:DNA repair protein RecO (recombination protein O)
MRKRAEQEPGYVLHAYPYKETSLVLEAFTHRFGRVGLLARGARRPRSALRGVLLAFHPLRLSWSASAELGTLVAAEWSGGPPALAGIRLMCGFYLNELVLKLLPRDDPHERLFEAYAASLARLSAGQSEAAVLRGFERRMLAEIGYAPQLERDAASGGRIDPAKRYLYQPDLGPVEAVSGYSELVVSGQTLIDMAADAYESPATRDEARRLMRALIAERLNGQPLHTRAVLAELQDL